MGRRCYGTASTDMIILEAFGRTWIHYMGEGFQASIERVNVARTTLVKHD